MMVLILSYPPVIVYDDADARSYPPVIVHDGADAMSYPPVIVHDGVDPVSYGDDGAVLEGSPDGLLDELIRLQVYSCGGFVQNQNL